MELMATCFDKLLKKLKRPIPEDVCGKVAVATVRALNYLKVWSPTQFFLLPFCLKIINLPGGQINDPSLGKDFSLPFLPSTPSSPSQTLEGLFELTWRPSRALDLPQALLPELQMQRFWNFRPAGGLSGHDLERQMRHLHGPGEDRTAHNQENRLPQP